MGVWSVTWSISSVYLCRLRQSTEASFRQHVEQHYKRIFVRSLGERPWGECSAAVLSGPAQPLVIRHCPRSAGLCRRGELSQACRLSSLLSYYTCTVFCVANKLYICVAHSTIEQQKCGCIIYPYRLVSQCRACVHVHGCFLIQPWIARRFDHWSVEIVADIT